MKPTPEQLVAAQKMLDDADVPQTNREIHYLDDQGRYVIGKIDNNGIVSKEYPDAKEED